MHVQFDQVPVGVELRVGTMASVLVMLGDGDLGDTQPVPSALR